MLSDSLELGVLVSQSDRFVETLEELVEIYGEPGEASKVKVTSVITEDYRKFIEVSPFLTLATAGSTGLDCSPRGDEPGFVRVVSPKMVQMPDRRGNNRIDSLRNLLHDPRIAMLFFLPGCKYTLRLNGAARISIDPSLLESFAIDNKRPRSVMVVDVHEVYFQCGRALMRSDLWNPQGFRSDDAIPTPGKILANLTNDRIDGEQYDKDWPDRAKDSLW